MNQKDFLEKIGKLFDEDAKFKPSGYGIAQRTFTDTERTAFLQHLWELFGEDAIDFESVEFILALQRVEKKYDSVQEQAVHLGESLLSVRESFKTKMPAAMKVP